ncbi:MAG TPA: dethiobiotin synthase [Chthoniobacterales bacterium]|nr:dethiobiotin synthase [Chthoniobacterales bacterium]
MSILVTGTDTGVGKTTFSVWLVTRLRERGLRCAGYKPICCGDRQDAELLLAASSSGLTIEEINPLWLRTPAAPLTAAQAEHREIDLASLCDGFVRLKDRMDVVVVEGVGGWIVPITRDYFSSDLASDLRLPVLVVAQNRLGCLNHTFLTVRSIAAAGLNCLGVVLNNQAAVADDVAMDTNAGILRQCLTIPVIDKFDPESTEMPAQLDSMLSRFA